MGNYLEDPPIKLLDFMLSDISDYGGQIDAILIAGDLVVHGLSNSDPNHANWPKMKDVVSAITASVRRQFPGVPIIPSIGNNDVLNYYKTPNEDKKALFYGDLYDIWFANTAQAGVQNTFMQGGFYRVDLAEGISVLSINSILLNTLNSVSETTSETLQRQWLEDQLSNTSDSSRFFLLMHIPPGQWWDTHWKKYWKDDILDAYLALFATYQSRIIMLLSAHAHPGEVRAPVSAK